MSGYIVYDKKKGVEYGKVCWSKRDGDQIRKTFLNLGRVIDKDKHMFQNRVLQKYVWSVLTRSKITGGQIDHIFVWRQTERTETAAGHGDRYGCLA